MPKHVALPRDRVRALDEAMTHAHSVSEAQRAKLADALARLNERKARGELDAASHFSETVRLRGDARAAILSTFDQSAIASAIAELRDSLDPDRLVEQARFLPPVSVDDAQAADTRRLAEHFVRQRYREVVRRPGFDHGAEAARIERVAGEDANGSDALARLDELHEATKALPAGPHRDKARAIVAGTQARVFRAWREHAEAVATVEHAERKAHAAGRVLGMIDGATERPMFSAADVH